MTKFQNEVRLIALKGITWRQRRRVLASEKGLQLIKVITPPVFNCLFKFRTVFSRPRFSVQQQQEECQYAGSYKAGGSKYQAVQNPTYQIVSLTKELFKRLFAKADSLIEKSLSCPRIELSNLQTFLVDGVETAALLSDFAQQKRPTNADVPDVYYTFLTPLVYL